MYAMDLIRKFGFRYFWPDSGVEYDKFGDYRSYESDAALRQAIATYGPWRLLYKRLGVEGFSLIDFQLDASATRSLFLAMFNRTIIRVPAADGLPMAAFKRYRGQWNGRREFVSPAGKSRKAWISLESAGGHRRRLPAFWRNARRAGQRKAALDASGC